MTEPLEALGELEREVRWQLHSGPPGIDPMASLNHRNLNAKFDAVRALAVTPGEPHE